MSIFFWKKNRLIDEFACQLADTLYSDIQPSVASAFFNEGADTASGKNPKKDKQKHQQIIRALNSIILKIQQFRELHGLKIYGKARLHLTFTERLKELGYSPEVADQVNRMILLQTP